MGSLSVGAGLHHHKKGRIHATFWRRATPTRPEETRRRLLERSEDEDPGGAAGGAALLAGERGRLVCHGLRSGILARPGLCFLSLFAPFMNIVGTSFPALAAPPLPLGKGRLEVVLGAIDRNLVIDRLVVGIERCRVAEHTPAFTGSVLHDVHRPLDFLLRLAANAFISFLARLLRSKRSSPTEGVAPGGGRQCAGGE